MLHAKVLDKLNEIEAEMRSIGYWSESPPDLQRAASEGKLQSYLDAPSFELWLQALFLPNARAAAEEDRLPSSSQVGVMALRQYDYHSHIPEAQNLLRLLHEFDNLIVSSADETH